MRRARARSRSRRCVQSWNLVIACLRNVFKRAEALFELASCIKSMFRRCDGECVTVDIIKGGQEGIRPLRTLYAGLAATGVPDERHACHAIHHSAFKTNLPSGIEFEIGNAPEPFFEENANLVSCQERPCTAMRAGAEGCMLRCIGAREIGVHRALEFAFVHAMQQWADVHTVTRLEPNAFVFEVARHHAARAGRRKHAQQFLHGVAHRRSRVAADRRRGSICVRRAEVDWGGEPCLYDRLANVCMRGSGGPLAR